MGNLLDNTEQGGDDDGGLESLPKHYKENWNGEHVRHDCFGVVTRTNDDGREGALLGEGGAREKRRRSGEPAGGSHSITPSCLAPGRYQIKKIIR